MEGIWPLKDASDSPTLTGWSTTWRQRQSHCTLGSRPGSSQSASNSHQPNRLSSHPKPSQTCHVSRNSASTFSPCPFHHHCPARMLEGWRRGMYQRAQHPPTQCSGLPSRKTAKETEESHFFIGKKKKKILNGRGTRADTSASLSQVICRIRTQKQEQSASTRLTHLTWGTTAISGAALTKPQGACQWPGPQAVSRSGCSQATRLQRVASFRELPLCYHTQPDYQSWTQGSKEKIEELTPPTPLWTWNRKRGQLGRHTPGQGAPALSLSPLLKN